MSCFSKAEPYLQRALEIYQKQCGEYDAKTLLTRIELGYLYLFWMQPDKNVPMMVKALEGCRRVFGNRDPNTLEAMNILGSVYMQWSVPAADSLLNESWVTARQVLGPEHEYTLLYECVLGLLRQGQGRLEEAEARLTHALKDLEHRPSHHRCHFMTVLSQVYKDQKCFTEAEAWVQRAIQEGTQSHGQAHRETIFAQLNMANIYIAQGRYDEAETILKEAAKTRRENDPAQTDWIHPHQKLIVFYASLARYGQMEQEIAKFEADHKPATEDNRRRLVILFNQLGWLLATHPSTEVRNGEKAVVYAVKACEVSTSNWENAYSIDTLAAAYAATGNCKEAVKRQMQAIEKLRETSLESILMEEYKERLKLYESNQPYHSQDTEYWI
jgi:tetratricopeptide (TPR) repeat protein